MRSISIKILITILFYPTFSNCKQKEHQHLLLKELQYDPIEKGYEKPFRREMVVS